MSSLLKHVLMHLTVPELKGLANLADVSTGGIKEQITERICSVMLGQGLRTIWAGLDATQQAAVAEATHHFYGEYQTSLLSPSTAKHLPLTPVSHAETTTPQKVEKPPLPCFFTGM